MNIESILKELTIEEKARLCMGDGSWRTAGVERLSISSIYMSDGPHGIRKQPETDENDLNVNTSMPATCFPPAALASCSFNRKLIYRMGEAIAEEAINSGVDVVLGPAVNIKRSPLCGRNFEYVSEDPYLAGEYAVSFINGVQSRGVGACIKHFAANNQEYLRMNIDALIDERALREIYLYAFEEAVKSAKPYAVMASYNRINGGYGCENDHTLKDILRSEWGFKGLVMSDWGAVNDRVKALKAGCDLEMPESGDMRTCEIVDAVKKGVLDESVLDGAVSNVLKLVSICEDAKKLRKDDIYESNDKLAGQIAAESMVLLKNRNNILPLSSEKKYALIGAFAETPRYQGGGSSHITPVKLSTVKEVCSEKKLNFSYSPGYDVNSERIDEKLISEAAKNAADADAALIFIGLTDLYEYEGVDRRDMSIPPAHVRLLHEVYKANRNVVVVLCAGSAVEMDWENECSAILYAGVMGQSGSRAIIDILFGNVNPSGRLSETFPMKLSDTPAFHNFPGGNNSVRYMESIYVGYRYYSTARVGVRYPFGFGLSYTSFKYSNLVSDKTFVGENDSLRISITVKNTGMYDGAEVVQIYIRNNTGNTFTPAVVLKNFEKLFLLKGEEREVTFKIRYCDFMRYDPSSGWAADTGDYEILAGKSCEDLKQGIHVRVEGLGKKQLSAGLEKYFKLKDNVFDKEQFQNLYGKPMPPLDISYKPIGMNTPLEFCMGTIAGKLIYTIAKHSIKKANRGRDAYAARTATIASLKSIPIRSLVVMSDGANLRTGEGLVKIINGKVCSGLKEVIKSL